MRSMARVLSLVASWWFTALLFLALCAVYLVLSFGKNPYPAWVAFLFHSPGGIAVLLGLVVNLLAASARVVLKRLLVPSLSPEYIRSLDVHAVIPIPDTEQLREAAASLGIASLDIPEQGLRRLTGRWSFLPGAVFRAGMVLLLLGLLTTAHLRRVSDAAVHEGEQAELLGDSVTLTKVSADLPADYLQVGEEGTFLLEHVSATISSNGRSAVITPGFPARLGGHWYRIRHLGYSQTLSASLRGRRDDLTADLDLLPPGKTSIVSLPSGLAFLTFSLDPDRTITKGLLTGRQYNLLKPAYRVKAQEGKPREAAEGKRMRPDDRAAVGPVEVSLGRQGLSVRIEAVSDPGLPFLYAGTLALLAGLCAMPVRFFWYEREIALLARDGKLHVGARDEFFKKWGIERFRQHRINPESNND